MISEKISGDIRVKYQKILEEHIRGDIREDIRGDIRENVRGHNRGDSRGRY